MPLSVAVERDPSPSSARGGGAGTVDQMLVTRLGLALADEGIRYCQWKGQAKFARWSVGDGDVDLLVARADAPAFIDVLHDFGFKLALPPADRQVPGVMSYLGLDEELGRLIHVHLHCHLVIGRSWSRHYRLPIECVVLGTAVHRIPFRTPAPEFELVLLVLGMVLRHSVREINRRGWLSGVATIQLELERLEHEVSRAALTRTVTRYVPEIDMAFFDRCRDTLAPGRSRWHGLVTRIALERRLSAHGCGPRGTAMLRRTIDTLRRAGRLGNPPSLKVLAHGGALIALVGGDGAGKSSCARALERWLAPELLVRRVHFGRPPRSFLTLVAGGLLKVARWLSPHGHHSPSSVREHVELLRYVCTARDRYRLYLRIRRFTRVGGVALCERYPIPENRALVGPSAEQGRATTAASWIATLLRRVESRYYEQMTRPDVVFVLLVDPETAQRRKPEEPAEYVRARAGMLWEQIWSTDDVVLIDARRPFPAVLAALRVGIWKAL